MMQRGGQVVIHLLASVQQKTIEPFIKDTIVPGTLIYTDELQTKRNELHYTNVYKWHNRWSKNGSYQTLFHASIIQLHQTDQLDTSVLHGDGSNTVVKKGA